MAVAVATAVAVAVAVAMPVGAIMHIVVAVQVIVAVIIHTRHRYELTNVSRNETLLSKEVQYIRTTHCFR